MEVLRTPREMRSAALRLRREGRSIGFVPTMGCLHAGHLSLIRIARKRADIVVVSIFVNPTQFGPAEDYETYPRNLDDDLAQCAAEGADIVFCPETGDMYQTGHSVFVDEQVLAAGLCGASRPGHFRGVLTVVTKLFHIVSPDFAVFGQKDAQQAVLIRRLVRDLDFPLEIVVGPTVREPDGLALSSRNRYLTAAERRDAPCLYRALEAARRRFAEGSRDPEAVRTEMIRSLRETPAAEIDYACVVDAETLQAVETIAGPVLAALAVRIGRTRLIDNAVLRSGA